MHSTTHRQIFSASLHQCTSTATLENSTKDHDLLNFSRSVWALSLQRRHSAWFKKWWDIPRQKREAAAHALGIVELDCYTIECKNPGARQYAYFNARAYAFGCCGVKGNCNKRFYTVGALFILAFMVFLERRWGGMLTYSNLGGHGLLASSPE